MVVHDLFRELRNVIFPVGVLEISNIITYLKFVSHKTGYGLLDHTRNENRGI